MDVRARIVGQIDRIINDRGARFKLIPAPKNIVSGKNAEVVVITPTVLLWLMREFKSPQLNALWLATEVAEKRNKEKLDALPRGIPKDEPEWEKRDTVKEIQWNGDLYLYLKLISPFLGRGKMLAADTLEVSDLAVIVIPWYLEFDSDTWATDPHIKSRNGSLYLGCEKYINVRIYGGRFIAWLPERSNKSRRKANARRASLYGEPLDDPKTYLYGRGVEEVAILGHPGIRGEIGTIQTARVSVAGAPLVKVRGYMV